MKIIDRMIIREFIPNFLTAQLILVFVLIINRIFELANLLIGKGVPFSAVFNLFINTLPFIIFLTIPMAVLVAAIMTFGRLSSDFELTAMQACGLDIGVFIRNILLFSVVLFITAYIFSDFIVPDSNHRVKILLSNISRMRPSVTIEEGVVKKGYENDVRFFFQEIDNDGNFHQGRIFKREQTVSASSGKIYPAERNKNIVYLKDGRIVENQGERVNIIDFREMYSDIKVSEDVEQGSNIGRGDREMTTMMLARQIGRIYARDPDMTRSQKRRVYRYLVEIHKKFSISFGVFGFIVLGSILGVMLRKSGMGVGFGLSAALFVLYYIMIVVGEQLSDKGIVHPSITMWFPNILTLILSGLLIYFYIYRMPPVWLEKILNLFSEDKH
ncbi:MAG: LptF/LptG family permease [candidate division WOR-3 bacterium]|nr:LptF/LptG family permease [candidate division WOR-3 bacterium]